MKETDIKYRTKIFLLVFLLVIINSCSSVPRFTSKNDTRPVVSDVKTEDLGVGEPVDYVEENEVILDSIIGLASFYAEPFHGRETSNGEIYDKYGLTAAHNSWPFNTLIKVTNLNNNKSVKVRINDRMPKHPARIVDLSYGTALQLDMLNDGVVKVRLDILKWGEEN